MPNYGQQIWVCSSCGARYFQRPASGNCTSISFNEKKTSDEYYQVTTFFCQGQLVQYMLWTDTGTGATGAMTYSA